MRTTSRSAATSVFAVSFMNTFVNAVVSSARMHFTPGGRRPTHFSTSALTDFTVSIALASGDL